MIKKLFYILLLVIVFIAGWFLRGFYKTSETKIAINNKFSEPKEKQLDKYSIENLSKTDIKPGYFEINDTLKEADNCNSYLFTYEFNPDLDGKTFKKVTGQINLPITEGSEPSDTTYPIVLMFRGYIDQKLYKTGDGTRNVSEYLAKEGFITIAPDFLGYGSSDTEVENIFETRFQTYVTAVSLIKFLEQLPNNPKIISVPVQLTNQLINQSSIFLWGHSNGGQIALTTLEITGANYPTTLWAPVSKPFPYSVLYYTDQSEDNGKLIRTELAKLEIDYDVEKYSLTNYLDRINAPIQIHQGEVDEAVPLSWSNTLTNLLKQKGKDITYYTYPGTDHNMRPIWNTVVERDVKFFKSFLED